MDNNKKSALMANDKNMNNRRRTGLKSMLIQCLGAFCLIFIFSGAYAQEDVEIEIDEDGEIQAGEIVIEKDRKIEMPQARKLYDKVKTPKFDTEHLKLPSNFQSFEYNPSVQLPRLRAAAPKSTGSKEEIYDHYLKVGYGNFASPLLQADLNLITDKNKVFRANLDHQSFGNGAKDKKNSASAYTGAGINGVIIGDQVSLKTGLNYSTTTDYFYGYQPGFRNQSG